MQQEQPIISILLRYSKNEELTVEEKSILNRWLEESKSNKLLFDELSDRELWHAQVEELQKKDGKQTWEIIEERIREQGGFRRSLPAWTKFVAAIIIVFLLLVIGERFVRNKRIKNNADPGHIALVNRDIKTGNQYATLNVNGQVQIILDNKNIDSLHKLGYQEQNTDSVSLSYSKKGLNNKEETNILTTPRGGTFQLELSDGTKVWLNTNSSFTYPAVFAGSERRVKLNGEAYFEVAKNPSKPFLVETGQSVVRVLGTHFNVEAYSGTYTTLMEGSVEMSTEKNKVILRPGQQGEADNNHSAIQITSPDLEQVLAWRKNNFWFNNAGYPEIMKVLARWYPMQVQFSDSVNGHFTGILPRDRSLSRLLDILEGGGHVHFIIDGDRVIVKAK